MFILALPFVIDWRSSRTARNTMHGTDSGWPLGIGQRCQTAQNSEYCYRKFSFHFASPARLLGTFLRSLNSWMGSLDGTLCRKFQHEYSDEKTNERSGFADYW